MSNLEDYPSEDYQYDADRISDYVYRTDYYELRREKLTIGNNPVMLVQLCETEFKIKDGNGLPKESFGWYEPPARLCIIVEETDVKRYWNVDREDADADAFKCEVFKCELPYNQIYKVLVELTEVGADGDGVIENLGDLMKLIFSQNHGAPAGCVRPTLEMPLRSKSTTSRN